MYLCTQQDIYGYISNNKKMAVRLCFYNSVVSGYLCHIWLKITGNDRKPAASKLMAFLFLSTANQEMLVSII